MSPPRLANRWSCWPLAAAIALLVAGCAGTRSGAPAAASAGPAIGPGDITWLRRVGFGLDSAGVQSFARQGRERYLDAQLHPGPAPLPAAIESMIDAMQVSHLDLQQTVDGIARERRRIDGLAGDEDRDQARKALYEQGNRLAMEAARRDLLRAVYSPAQLQEQMTWFWLNHFSVYQNKAELRWLVGDYEEQAIRPHALGRFRDLVLATLEHPAMLQYLDNRQNRVHHSNENYARELLELHTLGVDAGYTQQDVQQLARILTGVGINAGPAPALKGGYAGLYVHRGLFEFNPAQHDFGDKVLLGQTIHGSGFDEVRQAVTLITRRQACAHFIATKLARHFVADDPPPALVERLTQAFVRTDGDIAAVLRALFLAPEFDASVRPKFKDPQRFVVSAVRFAYDGHTIGNARPMLRWLADLGEAPYGHQTPDGYAAGEAAWASSGQMSRRFEIARAIGSGSAGLFDAEDGAPPAGNGFPQLSNRLYFSTLEPLLSARTRSVLDRSGSAQEWNMLLLSSAEFNYE